MYEIVIKSFKYVLFWSLIVLYYDIRITDSSQSCMILLSNRSNVNAWTLRSTIILNLYVNLDGNQTIDHVLQAYICRSMHSAVLLSACISTYPPNCRQPHQNGSVLFLLPCPATGA